MSNDKTVEQSCFSEVQRDLVRTQSRLALVLIGLYTNRHSLKTATGNSLLPYLQEESAVTGIK